MGGALFSFAIAGRLAQVAAWLGAAPVEAWLLLSGLVAAGLLYGRERRSRAAAGCEHLGAAALPSYRVALPRLGQELTRMRRYERPLAVVVLRVGADGGHEQAGNGRNGSHRAHAGDTSPIAFGHAGVVLRDLLRDTDLAACDFGRQRYIVLLPETNREQAEQAAGRLAEHLGNVTPLALTSGVAEFPADGLIVDELVKSAAADCEKRSFHSVAVH